MSTADEEPSDAGNDLASVKSRRPLYQLESYTVKASGNEQAGIGLSITAVADGGIRFNDNSIGFGLKTKKTCWGSSEGPTPEGWNTHFADMLKVDPDNETDDVQIAVDYTTNTVHYKHPKCFAITYVLPKPFHGKPLYAHVQVLDQPAASTKSTKCLPFYQCCLDNKFNIASFKGFNEGPEQAPQHVTETTLRVSGGDWNKVNSVKTIRVLAQDEWIGAISTQGDQYGIGVSITEGADGGIRFNQNSVGFYFDDQRCYWGPEETPTSGGLNEDISGQFVKDPEGFDGMWVKVDYITNMLWFKYPYMMPISFELPDAFNGKLAFGHYQVWNSCSLRYAYPIPSSNVNF